MKGPTQPGKSHSRVVWTANKLTGMAGSSVNRCFGGRMEASREHAARSVAGEMFDRSII